jgi:L-fuconolactonase
MKIDVHQHFWQFSTQQYPWIDSNMPGLRRDFLPVDCEAEMQRAGIQVALAVQARDTPEETDFLLHLADKHASILGVVGWIDLQAADIQAQIERWRPRTALKGMRHILQAEADPNGWMTNERVTAGLNAVQRAAWVYEVLLQQHQLANAAAFCARHDQHWLVLDHLGKPALRDWPQDSAISMAWNRYILELAALPHVMCKLSGLVTETNWMTKTALSETDIRTIWTCFDRALDAFGAHRLMYGSDWPVCLLAGSYSQIHGLAHDWAQSRLSQDEQAAFWSGNAIRCYGLEIDHG